MPTYSCALIGSLALLSAYAGDSPANNSLGKLPFWFEENRGQSKSTAAFLSQRGGSAIELATSTASVRVGAHNFLVSWPGSRAVAPEPERELPGKVNYLSTTSIRNVRTFEGVRYRALYPGIDLVFHGAAQSVEFDFELAKGADPGQIAIRLPGRPVLQPDGSITFTSGSDQLVIAKPVSYQWIGGTKRVVESAFQQRGITDVSFVLGAYDREYPLIIDPPLLFSTHIGGPFSPSYLDADNIVGVGLDGKGNVYVGGWTAVPATGDEAQAFVFKLSAGGDRLIYATYFGGPHSTEIARAMAVKPTGEVALTGTVTGSGMPVSSNAWRSQPTIPQNQASPGDLFIVLFDRSGQNILYATYFGDGDAASGTGIAFDRSGRLHVVGTVDAHPVSLGDPYVTSYTISFPETSGALIPRTRTAGPASAAFLSVFNPAAFGRDTLDYSTLLGPFAYVGPGFGLGVGLSEATAVAVSDTGWSYVCGTSHSGDYESGFSYWNVSLMVLDTLQPGVAALKGAWNLDNANTFDAINAVALGTGGLVYMAGSTTSATLRTTPTAVQSFRNGTQDGFVAVVSLDSHSSRSATVYLTYFGGAGVDQIHGLAIHGNLAYIVGETDDSYYLPPTSVPSVGRSDAFWAIIDPFVASWLGLVYSTSVGGAQDDRGYGIATSGNTTYIVGTTTSYDFPTTPGALQRTWSEPRDGFLAAWGTPPTHSTVTVATVNTAGAAVGQFAVDSNRSESLDAADRVNTFVPAKDLTGAIPIVGDWSGDGRDKLGLVIAGVFYLDYDGDGVYNAAIDKAYHFAPASGVPVTGDWTGDGRKKIGWFTNDGVFYLDINADGAYTPGVDARFDWTAGTKGWRPVIGDWNGDGRDKIGTFWNNMWMLDYNGDGLLRTPADRIFHLGTGSGTPIVGDWNGDGRTKVGLYTPDSFQLDYYGAFAATPGVFFDFRFAGSPGVPVVGDWNNDGRQKVGVFTTTAKWLIDFSGDRSAPPRSFTFGEQNPLVGRF
jgi:hypothetical protein